jgi:formylglycine-generating enzyme required for sulfatase activity
MNVKLLLWFAALILCFSSRIAWSAASDCNADAALAGPTCVDKFEASVWSVADPSKVASLKRLALGGKATAAQLTALGAVQRGVSADDYPCNDNGNDCKDKIFAFSIPGVKPSAYITWFQAQQAAGNSGKRLLTNAEWQMAAAGTPNAGFSPGAQDCNTNSSGADFTGARANCVSNWGAFDMVGNVFEWVADWVPQSSDCVSSIYENDVNCFAGVDTFSTGSGALDRGGDFSSMDGAGVFAISGGLQPWVSNRFVGFRCGR